MFFFFKIFLLAKRLIKLCYVNIGWLCEGRDLLYFSANKSHEGLANGRGEAKGEQEKENVFREYEPKANECFRLIY
jgi:hypothetical protein